MKKQLISSIFIFLSVVMVITTVVFAWVVLTFRSEEIIVTTGSIKVEANLFYATDENYDGNLDLVSGEPVYNPITSPGITFTEVIPGQKYTYRLVITNTGTSDGFLSIYIKDILTIDSDMYQMLKITYINPVNDTLTEVNLNNQNVTLFNDYLLDESAILNLDFIIEVRTNANNDLQNSSISIGFFEVRLNQIANQS